MKAFMLVTLLLFLIHIPRAQAAIYCAGLLAEKAAATTSDANLAFREFWQKNSPIQIEANTVTKPVTFSFDSELPHSEIFKIFLSDEVLLEKLRAMIHEMKFLENTEISPTEMTFENLMQLFKISRKQVLQFVVRRQSRNKENFDVTDLNPLYFDKILNRLLEPGNNVPPPFDKLPSAQWDSRAKFLDFYIDVSRNWLVKNNFDVNSHLESQWLEISHPSSETIPQNFRATMRNLKKVFPRSQTHMHIGFPVEIGDESFHAIVRAVEARIILELAAEPFDPSNPLYATTYTALTTFTGDSKNRAAGVIRAKRERWKSPVFAHDLEIREGTQEEQLENAALGANLAQNYAVLRTFDIDHNKKVTDLYTSNLPGALEYAGKVLASNQNPDWQDIGKKLMDLSKQIFAEGSVSPEIRDQVEHFLNKQNVVALLANPAIYLTSRSSTASR